MGKTLNEIAQELKASNKKVQLIYAFNGTGKTRLSREFKDLVTAKAGESDEEDTELTRTKIIYYNAFTEDLFYWDNDLEFDIEPKLMIHPNSFTNWVIKEQGQDQNIITNFQHYTSAKITPMFSEIEVNNQKTFQVTFDLARGNENLEKNIKISKGEESNFIWSVFYSLLEQVIEVLNVAKPSAPEDNRFFYQLGYVFIDDPVSSLDENHLIELAVDVAHLIKSSESKELKFIISTHNSLFYNVLYNELDVKSGYILRKNEDGLFELEEKKGDSNKSFSYHLFLIQTLEQAIEQNAIQKYHFTLLRNLYEKTASFLGYLKWQDLLPDDRQAYYKRIITFTSHSSLSNEAVAEPNEQEKQIVKFLLNHLIDHNRFWKQEN